MMTEQILRTKVVNWQALIVALRVCQDLAPDNDIVQDLIVTELAEVEDELDHDNLLRDIAQTADTMVTRVLGEEI